MHLRQPGFRYGACRPLLITMKEYKNLKKQKIQYLYQNKLNKGCFL